MASYVSSNNNRYYVALESSYGVAAAIQAVNRIPAVTLRAKHERERSQRRDKTGSRTHMGGITASRTRTTFQLNTYMATWATQDREPAHGALFEAAMGGPAEAWTPRTVQSVTQTQVTFTTDHGLSIGQAFTWGGEIRFVEAVIDSRTVQVNAAFTSDVGLGTEAGGAATYRLARDLKSATLFDYWSPETAVHRILSGSAVDRMRIKVNGDFHEFEFSGIAADLIDSSSFTEQQAALAEYPVEPEMLPFEYAIVPGHLGQAWLGSASAQFFTLASADLTLNNHVDSRNHEFGSSSPRAIVAGNREVNLDFSVYAQDDEATKALYQAARQQSPMGVMIQLGSQSGQLLGVYMKSVVPEVPEYDDGQTRLIWHFRNCKAQGISDDELVVAFG